MSVYDHTNAYIDRLQNAAPGKVARDVDLSKLTRWHIGGLADVIVEPVDEQQVSKVLRVLHDEEVPYCVIGNTSNLLFDSGGLRGVVVRVSSQMSQIEIDGTEVLAGAGTAVPTLARTVGARGLTGIEHTGGIPGTVGGLVLMNGGSQRKGIGENVVWVRYVDGVGTAHVLTQEQCEFSYRHSSLQQRDGVVVAVGLRLGSGDPSLINAEIDRIVAARRRRFPEDKPNCGSTFLSDPAMYSAVGPPGKIIEELGLKGLTIGGAQVSCQHANFINNRGGATSDDILSVISMIRERVYEHTGFLMDSEVRYVSSDGTIKPAHEESDRRLRVESGRAKWVCS